MNERRQAPWPLIEISVEPKAATDEAKLMAALNELSLGDPLFTFARRHDGHAICLGGVDERQLDAKITALQQVYGLEVDVAGIQVAYRETLLQRIEQDFTHEQRPDGGHRTYQLGAHGVSRIYGGRADNSYQFAHLTFVFEPSGDGEDNAFDAKTKAAPATYISAIEREIRLAFEAGPLSGSRVTGIKATLLDVEFEGAYPLTLPLEMAARGAIREAIRKGGAILEPIMRMEVRSPSDCAAVVTEDLKSRRGEIQSIDTRDEEQVINAVAPLACLFGYANNLNAFSNGRAAHAMRFDHYAHVPSLSGRDKPPPATA